MRSRLIGKCPAGSLVNKVVLNSINTTGKKYGGRSKGTPNRLSNEIKNKLSNVIREAIDTLDLEDMSKVERLKLIQLGLPYIVTKPQIEEPQQEEQKFTIEIIDRLDKHKDKELDKAIIG